MSLKAIEMQVALPRMQDAGRMQNQIQKQAQTMQNNIAVEAQKKMERSQISVLKHESKDILRFKKEELEKNLKKKRKSMINRDEEIIEVKHPYKGTKIDFSG